MTEVGAKLVYSEPMSAAERSSSRVGIDTDRPAFSAYDDFTDGRTRTIDGTAIDKFNQTYLAAGDSTATLFKQANGAAWQGGYGVGSTPGNGYMSLDAQGVIETIYCDFKIVPSSTSATIAIVVTNDTAISGVSGLANLLHLIVSKTDWNLQIRLDGNANPLTSIASGNFSSTLESNADPALAPVHRIVMWVRPDRNDVVITLPEGYYRPVTVQDDRIGRLLGSRAYWQIIRSPATDDQIGITRIGLTRRSSAPRAELETISVSGNLNVGVKTTVIDATAGNVTITLPVARRARGHEHRFVRKDSSGNTVTISGTFLDGSASKTIAAGGNLSTHADYASDVWVSF
jgi:hypothetical protein